VSRAVVSSILLAAVVQAALAGLGFYVAGLGKVFLLTLLTFFGALVPQFLDTKAPLMAQYLIMYAVTFIGESVILTFYGALAAAGGRMANRHHAIWRAVRHLPCRSTVAGSTASACCYVLLLLPLVIVH
jgi:hypothetical protein